MSDFLLPGHQEEKRDPPLTSTGLPPEVEAELRARSAQGTPPPSANPSATGATVNEAGGPTLMDRLKAWGPLGATLIFLATKLKFLSFLLPVIKTGGSMFVYAWVYASMHGWPFAIGFVLGIFVHEMGHVLAMWRYRYPLSAPLFIPFFGAIIFHRAHLRSAWESAVIGIAGPIAGTLAGLGFYAAWLGTGSSIWMALAYVTFMLNLFNLAPFGMLDGGWITGAISPRIWLVGLLLMGVMVFTGHLNNPLLILLLLISLPRIIHGLKTGDTGIVGQEPATVRQKQILGVAYVGLIGLLTWLMAHLHLPETLR